MHMYIPSMRIWPIIRKVLLRICGRSFLSGSNIVRIIALLSGTVNILFAHGKRACFTKSG